MNKSLSVLSALALVALLKSKKGSPATPSSIRSNKLYGYRIYAMLGDVAPHSTFEEIMRGRSGSQEIIWEVNDLSSAPLQTETVYSSYLNREISFDIVGAGVTITEKEEKWATKRIWLYLDIRSDEILLIFDHDKFRKFFKEFMLQNVKLGPNISRTTKEYQDWEHSLMDYYTEREGSDPAYDQGKVDKEKEKWWLDLQDPSAYLSYQDKFHDKWREEFISQNPIPERTIPFINILSPKKFNGESGDWYRMSQPVIYFSQNFHGSTAEEPYPPSVTRNASKLSYCTREHTEIPAKNPFGHDVVINYMFIRPLTISSTPNLRIR